MEGNLIDNRTDRDKLQSEEDRYRFLLENSGDILWTIDLTGRWQFVTKNVEKILHRKVSDIIGKTIWDIVAPEDHELIKEKLKRRMAGEDIPSYEVTAIDGFGRRVPFDVKTSPLVNKNGELIGVQGISRDISQRKSAEEAVRKSEEKFRDLVETVHDWVWESDRNFVFTYSNPRVQDYLGYKPEEVIGRPLFDFMDPGKAKKIREKLYNMIKQHKQFDIAEKTLNSKQGEPVAFEMTASLIYEEDGTLKGFRGICRDIRDRKRAEEALHKAYGELEKRVEERTEELQNAKAQAELYLDLMSHDINNMNMIALGNMELAEQKVASDKETAALLEKSVEMLKSSSRLIDNVRKIQQAKQGYLQRENVDMCEILEGAKKKFSSELGKNITIDISYPVDHGCLVTANKLLEDVFANLIGNAIKHSIPGKPIIIAIVLSKLCENGKEYYRVAIEDNGPGIPDEIKGKLFTRLQHGKAKTAGRGLGLYLVKTLVEDFKGKIWVEDRVKGDYRQGARFVVMLPTSRAEPGSLTGACAG